MDVQWLDDDRAAEAGDVRRPANQHRRRIGVAVLLARGEPLLLDVALVLERRHLGGEGDEHGRAVVRRPSKLGSLYCHGSLLVSVVIGE
jgi:hypothetical protein